MEPIIEIKGVGKKYNITHQRGGYIALRDIFANILRNPFKFAKQKAKQIVGLETKEEFWALRNINLEIQKGEIIGIIGHNGAGKSTLLKILSRITPPIEGEIIMRGKVASLLEVGTGFHPELTGRENIFLNGAIIGMTQKEIARKFDEIVAFAGVEKFLDTPVKYYSSGMFVRLAFSVAAHMEPDILIIDEVLAVGDAEFQKKCLGKMEEVTKAEGRTILFVSHNIGAIQQLCKKCALLEHGKLKSFGPTEQIVAEYLGSNKTLGATSSILNNQHLKGTREATITEVGISNKEIKKNAFLINEPIQFDINFNVQPNARPLSFWIIFTNQEGSRVLNTFQKDIEKPNAYTPGQHTIRVTLNDIGLMPGRYTALIGIFAHDMATKFDFADWVEPAQVFDIAPTFSDGTPFDGRWGTMTTKANWKTTL
ncbi:ABC transporter ATP-binding protein [Patescibacteria group bacterium]|nr:ABC transporter ATP-binding protein [Patescibacteria group bacterium]